MAVKLRDHQVEAVAAIVRGLDVPSGGIPWNGLRGQVHAACGTGKTIMAAASARRLVPRGRVLVLVPTLDLLAQTVRAWHEAGHKGTAVAVCSLQDDPGLWSLKVRSTTNPIQLALWHGSGPVTIYATYASLGVLAEAFEGVYGQQLDPVDLAVVDEAHRTSGSMGKAWADIHDQSVIPALRRLYLTATPRIWEERLSREVAEGVRDPLPREMAASMDDEKVFGPVLYKLSLASAVSRGLLARYQIIVLELKDPVVTPERLVGEERHTEEVRGQRLGALQAALLHTMAQHDLSTCITFHHRTIEAQAYAEGLERVAAKLHADQPETYPKRIWADWLCGEHVPEHRQKVLGSFGTTARRAVLSNCRVLGEGVDIRAVDSVALLDPKGAPHDIVQAIGRALRQKPGQGKLASLIVPVFLQPGERPEDMFTSGSYRPLVSVLEGLRAHDEEVVELLAIPQEPQKDVAQPSVNIGSAPEEGEEESRLLLRFATPRDPVMVADWVSFNVIDTERQDWARGWAKLKTYVERVGNARVPYGHREGATPLGQWVAEQRRAYAAGQMTGQRARRLEQLGMVWSPADERFQENLEAAKAYYDQHWTLCAPRSATMLDRPVGQWLSNLRRPGALDAHPEWKTALEAVDEDWNPAWPADWQRHYVALRELVADEHGQAGETEVLPGLTGHGMDIRKWLARQRKPEIWQALHDGQREHLERLGITPIAPEPEAPAKPSTTPMSAFEKGVAALTQYKTREGSVTVPRGHVETLPDGTDVRLGVWLTNAKTRRAKLTADKLAALATLGLDWARKVKEEGKLVDKFLVGSRVKGAGMPSEEELFASVDALLNEEPHLPPPAERARLREAAGITQARLATALKTTTQSVKNWENGRSEPKSPRLDAYQRLLNGWAAKYPAPGAVSAAATMPAAPAAPVASEVETKDAPQPVDVPGTGPARPATRSTATSRRPAVEKAARPAADPRFLHGPLAVLDGDGCAYGTGGIVLDCPATTIPELVEWTLRESGLGAPKLNRYGKDSDPLIVLTAAAAVKLGLPERLEGHEQRRSLRLPEDHPVVKQVVKAKWRLTQRGFGPWARVYRKVQGRERQCVQLAVLSWDALDERSWPGVAEMEPAEIARVLGVYAQRVITPRGSTAVSGLELMTALRPPTRAVQDPQTGNWVPGHNPGSLGTEPMDPAPPEATAEHPVVVGSGWSGGFLNEEACQWVRDVSLLSDEECTLPYAVGLDLNTAFLAAAARLVVGLSAPDHFRAPAFNPKIPGSWLVDLSHVEVDPRLPSPFTPDGTRPTGPAWYQTHTVAYAQELGHNVQPLEAYLRRETGAYLDPWHDRLKTAYVDTLADLGVTKDLDDAEFLAAMERHKDVDPAMAAVLAAIKATVKGGIGKLRERPQGKRYKEGERWPALQRPTWRPDIRAAVISKARINMHRKLRNMATMTGLYPLAVLSDCVVYPSPGPSPLDFLPYAASGKPQPGAFRLGPTPGLAKLEGVQSMLWAVDLMEQGHNPARHIKGGDAVLDEGE